MYSCCQRHYRAFLSYLFNSLDKENQGGYKAVFASVLALLKSDNMSLGNAQNILFCQI
jgi:hypothetical protein